MSDLLGYFDQARLLARVRAMPETSRELQEIVILALRSKPELRRPFFDGLTDPRWARIFFAAGFPYSTDPDDLELEAYFNSYLAAVAPEIPDLLPEILSKAQPKTHPALNALVQAVGRLPANRAAESAPAVAAWIEGSDARLFLNESLFRIVEQLLREKQTAGALALIKSALSPPHDSLALRTPDEVRAFHRRWHPILDDDKDRLRSLVPLIADAGAGEMVDVLEEFLLTALRVGSPLDFEDDTPDLRESFWRSAIEDTDQDRNDEVRDVLLVMLRDVMTAWLQSQPEEAVPRVEMRLQSGTGIMRRLGVHLVGTAPLACSAALGRLLSNADNYDDLTIHHEFFELLKRTASGWTDQLRARVLHIVLAGPGEKAALEHAEWVRDNRNSDVDVADEALRYSRHWTFERLWMLRGHIDSATNSLMSDLLAEFGEPSHPGFLFWSTAAYRVGERSPLTRDELSKLSPEEVIEKLRTWSPQADRLDPTLGPWSRAGLASEFEALVRREPRAWASLATPLIGASLHAEYYYHYLSGLRASIAEGGALQAAEVVPICRQFMDRDTRRASVAAAGEIGSSAIDAEIVELLGACADRADSTDHHASIRSLLIRLAHSTDPEPSIDSASLSDKQADPHLVALNHVRPRALSALIAVCVAEKRANKAAVLADDARALLEQKLRHEDDTSLSCHSVFGKSLQRLHWLDPVWLDGQLDLIFPEDQGDAATQYFQAAFDSFVLWGGGLPVDVYPRLRSKYKHALRAYFHGTPQPEGRHRDEATRALAAYVLVAYLLGLEDLPLGENEPSQETLDLFYERASPELRGTAVWNLWRLLKDEPDKHLHPGHLDRLMRLWDWRVESSVASGFSQQYDSEICWFAHWPQTMKTVLKESRLIGLLRRMLPHIARDWGATRALEEYLLDVSQHNPELALSVLRELHEVAHQMGISMMPQGGNERTLLVRALEAGGTARQRGLDLIDWLGRKGVWYKDLFDAYRPEAR